jgi:hypothetical protein
MKQLTSKNRKDLKNKMAAVLNDKIQGLSADMKEILLDDLVTAFETRFDVLSQAQENVFSFADMGVRIPNATIQA